MNIRKEFTRPECELLRKECNFTEDERAVFDYLTAGKTRVYMSNHLDMSLATVDRRIRSVKRKVDTVL